MHLFYIRVLKELVKANIKAPDSCFMRSGELLMVKFTDKKATDDKEIYSIKSKSIAATADVKRFEKDY